MQAGRLTLQPARTNIAHLVNDVVDQVHDFVPSQPFVVSAGEEIFACIDPLRLEQVIVNLLDNAVKFNRDGQPIHVDVTEPLPGTVCISVRDYGIGVPSHHRPHLFERFYQAHADTHRSGLGLGLFICHEIVERHGGQITADFPDDGGTRIVVTLPTNRAESASAC